MIALTEALDRALPYIMRRRAELLAEGAREDALLAIVAHESASPDGWPFVDVSADDATATGILASYDPEAKPPCALVVGLEGGERVVYLAAISFTGAPSPRGAGMTRGGVA
ncbi:MAG TPA: hypothetical protein VGG39_08830 [Polyangiaceae bacterium]|jgi:hypothetical protein